MDHIGNGAKPVQSIKAVQHLRGIGHADGHPVALADTHSQKTPGCGIDPPDKSGIGGRFAHKSVGRALGVLLRSIGKHLIHGLFGILQSNRGIFVKGQPGSFGG